MDFASIFLKVYEFCWQFSYKVWFLVLGNLQTFWSVSPWDSYMYWLETICVYVLFFFSFILLLCGGFFGGSFLFLNWEEMPVKVSVFITLSALACWWSVRWQIEAVKVRLEQFKKLPFLTASCVKCSKYASCILKNLMLNLCFCCINHQLWGFGFGFPPILWPSSCPKYFEDVSLVNSSPVMWLHMFHQTHNLKTIYVFIESTYSISVIQSLVLKYFVQTVFYILSLLRKLDTLQHLFKYMVACLSFSFYLACHKHCFTPRCWLK